MVLWKGGGLVEGLVGQGNGVRRGKGRTYAGAEGGQVGEEI